MLKLIFSNSRFSSVQAAPGSRKEAITILPSAASRVPQPCAVSHITSSFAELFPNVSTRGSIASIPGGTSRSSFESIWRTTRTAYPWRALSSIRVKSSSADVC